MSFILYSAFGSWKWVGLILAVVALSPLGGFLSLLITGTHFSVSSGLGFLALIGVSVEVGVIKDKDAHSYRVNGTAQPLWFMFSGGFESYLRSYSFNGCNPSEPWW